MIEMVSTAILLILDGWLKWIVHFNLQLEQSDIIQSVIL